jgi:hypothetical protein
MIRLLLALSVILVCAMAHAQQRTLLEWRFDKDGDLKGWAGANHVKDTRVEDGCLKVTVTDWDPFLIGPVFSIPATPTQEVQVAIRTKCQGNGEVFWTNTLDTQYQGFSPGKETPFPIVPSADFKVYSIRPYWQGEKTIIKLRLDFPPKAKDSPGDEYEVAWIRIVEMGTPGNVVVDPSWDAAGISKSWTTDSGGAVDPSRAPAGARLVAPALKADAGGHGYFAARMSATGGKTASVGLAFAESNGIHETSFPIIADGKMHVYNVPVGQPGGENRTMIHLDLLPTDGDAATARIDWVKLADSPQGPPDLQVTYLGVDEALPRAGRPCYLRARIANHGGEAAGNVRATVTLPAGVKLAEGEQATKTIASVDYFLPVSVEWRVIAAKPMAATFNLALTGPGMSDSATKATEKFLPSLGLPKAAYVPVPKPCKTDYNVGVYYFPGWNTWGAWSKIAPFPERTPVLGWYREGDPEVADWHIKWAVEHGIKFFCYDWYWSQGGRSLEHALHDGYLKARYRNLLKFCLLWANHNPPKTTTEDDLLKVTDYWIDNYFKLPEYYTIDDKPVIVIFSIYRIFEDLGTEGTKVAFAKMKQRCIDRGLKGLYLVGCAGSSEGELKRCKEVGYDAVSGYNYPSLGSDGKNYQPVMKMNLGYEKLWNEAADLDIIKEIPATSPGWDSRPWAGQTAFVRTERTPAALEDQLQRAKKFLDNRETPPIAKCTIIEAWNEWGEGSYIEPHKEYGFGHLDAVRKVFGDGRVDPSVDYGPQDVGLGPYDLKPSPPRTDWDFSNARDRMGWDGTMGFRDVQLADGALRGVTVGTDPAFFGPGITALASKYSFVEVEMSIDKATDGQLFWATPVQAANEAASVHFALNGDGQFHTYRIAVGENPYWRGVISSLRLDPGSLDGAMVAVKRIRLVER